MARRVFFSFHFERDIWRVGQVRNCWLTKADRKSAGYWDAAAWEKVKKSGDDAIKRWINNSLEGTSVTAVLIGRDTNDRKWVDYEIQQSRKRGNGMLGIFIHRIKDRYSNIDVKGKNPLDYFYSTDAFGSKRYYSEDYKSYDWVLDSGYHNLADWVETAAKNAGK